MLSLPIPIVAALILAYLLLRYLMQGGRSPWLIAFLLSLVVQSTIVALVQSYGMSALRPVQPVTAALPPPLAWLAFQHSAIRSARRPADLLHLLAPMVVALCVALLPEAIDGVLTALYVGYGVRLWSAVGNAGELPLARFEAGRRPVLIWRVIALALICSALGDLLIAVATAAGQPWLRPVILSVFSSLILLIVGALSLSPALEGDEAPSNPPDDTVRRKDADIMALLDDLLTEQQLYLDPDLSLARLSRRMGVPAKQVSAAVNRQTGENVSRLINGLRIQHACAQLKAGDNVTTTMLASGFNTKSNFNREFLRITGMAPSEWRRFPGQQ